MRFTVSNLSATINDIYWPDYGIRSSELPPAKCISVYWIIGIYGSRIRDFGFWRVLNSANKSSRNSMIDSLAFYGFFGLHWFHRLCNYWDFLEVKRGYPVNFFVCSYESRSCFANVKVLRLMICDANEFCIAKTDYLRTFNELFA